MKENGGLQVIEKILDGSNFPADSEVSPTSDRRDDRRPRDLETQITGAP